ncbi:MAG: CvpA family protein [Pirellulales bacterium]|nr:CvpA family protein [Pirellulales bacterium]
MQTYDALMLLVLLATTIFGFWKGMAWQIASLASLIVSYFASLRFSEKLAPMFAQTLNLQPPLNRFAAMLAVYVGSSFIIWMLFRLVSGAIDKVRLEAFDKQLGAMFGFTKGVLLCVVITFFAVTFLPQPQGEAIVGSQSGRYIVALLDKAHTVFPPELHQVINPYLDRIEKKLNPNFQPRGQDMQQLWQNQANSQPSTAWPQSPQIPWPTSQPPHAPQAEPSQQPSTAWPRPQTDQSTYQPEDPYRATREPNPFPGPYSARVPTGREY